jgi:uncharacterized DUF497 family protein
MPYYFFIWDEDNERHIREHGVTMDEFEEVVCDGRHGREPRYRSPDRLRVHVDGQVSRVRL